MKIAAIQMASGHDRAKNIADATALIDAAVAAERPALVMLPEVWSCLGGPRAGKFDAAEDFGSPDPDGAYLALRTLAIRHGIFVHGGSILERGTGDRLFNTSIVFDPQGAEIARYRKIHLFDIVTPDGTSYGESATFAPGEAVVTADVGQRLGLAICYDLRFPALFAALRRAGSELIALPSAFTTPTGRAHWEVLIRARAIETQCAMIAPATCGTHEGPDGKPRTTWGHSMIVDQWGTVAASLGDEPGWCAAEIDPAAIATVRRDMPVAQHAKPL